MSRFVTQAVEDQPLVLLIGEESWLLQEVASFLARRECQVEKATVHQVLKQPQLLEQDWFRIVWLEGWEEKSHQPLVVKERQKLVPTLLAKLDHSSTPLIFVSLLVSAFDTKGAELATFKDYFQWQLDLRGQLSNLKHAKVLAGQDVIAPNSSWWFPFSFFIHDLDRQVLLDPLADFYLVSSGQFLGMVKESIFRGVDGEKILIRGSKHSSGLILKELQRSYHLIYNTQLAIRNQPRQVVVPELAGFVVPELEVEALPDLLQSSIQALPSAKGAARFLNTRREEQKEPKSKKRTIKRSKTGVTSSQKPSSLAATSSSAVSPQPVILPIAETYSKEVSVHPSEADKPKKTEKKAQKDVQKDLDSKIKSTFSKLRETEKIQQLSKAAKSTTKLKGKNTKRKVSFFFGLMVVGAGVASVVLAVFFFFTQVWLKQSLQDLSQSGDLLAKNTNLWRLTDLVERQVAAYSLVLPSSFFTEATVLVTAASELQEVVTDMEKLEESQRQQLVNFFSAQPTSIGVESGTLSTAQNLYEKLSRVQSRLDGVWEASSGQDRAGLDSILAILDDQRQNLVMFQQLHPLLEPILGHQEKRSYALLFQNNQELRATGGFIQAIAVITVNEGQIIDSQTFSVYTLDQGLSGFVNPPQDLELLLGESQLFLRDSNWDPHFPTSAAQITWFLEQKLNKKIDGIIGLNPQSLVPILKAIGPVELPSYNEVLTDRNLMERLEFHSEVTLVETDQSSDYSQQVLAAVLGQLASLSQDKASGFLKAAKQSLQEKNLQVYMVRPGEESTFALLGWAGRMVQPECPARFNQGGCVVDTLAVIDSNIGVNKANYHLDRQDEHQVFIEQGAVRHQHQVTFSNTSHTNAWPKGAYKAYTRFYLPQGALVAGVKINNVLAEQQQLVELPNQHGFQVIGVVSNTPIQEQTKLEINYSLPYSAQDGFSYAFFVQKQAGVDQPLTNLKITHPPELRPDLIAPQAKVSGTTITFIDIENDHLFVGVAFE